MQSYIAMDVLHSFADMSRGCVILDFETRYHAIDKASRRLSKFESTNGADKAIFRERACEAMPSLISAGRPGGEASITGDDYHARAEITGDYGAASRSRVQHADDDAAMNTLR